MNQIAKIEGRPKSVLIAMADKYGMEPDAFEATVRATCMPVGRDAPQATKEEFAAFLLVAKEYGLNPITKEIYAYPRRGGGIVPIVSVDGWANLINSHPQCDGFDFDYEYTPNGDLFAVTCKIYRKDRKHPVVVKEFLSECIRQTEPWKMRHRMLRHKSLIQGGRYAFGFAGIYDEDEGERIAAARDVTPPPVPPEPPTIPNPPAPVPPSQPSAAADRPAGEPPHQPATPSNSIPDVEAWIEQVGRRAARKTILDELIALWKEIEPDWKTQSKSVQVRINNIFNSRKAAMAEAAAQAKQQAEDAVVVPEGPEPQPSEGPSLADQIEAAFSAAKDFGELDDAWSRIVETAREKGELSRSDVDGWVAMAYDKHRNRIDEAP